MAFFRTILGFWSTPVPSTPTDIEAQHAPVSGIYTQSLPAPAALHTHAPRTTATPSAPTHDAIDAFFGVASPKRGTLDSRHDEQPAPGPAPDAPPAYAYPLPAPLTSRPSSPSDAFPDAFPEDDDELPSYDRVLSGPDTSEPATLAQYFFKYGFLCPPLWFASLLIILSPLSAPEGWEPSKTPAERAALLSRMRAAEVKWARRSLAAAAVLTVVVVLAVAIAVTSK